MKVNYVLMYGTPYLKYREFETFEDMSKFIVLRNIFDYSIFEKMEEPKKIERTNLEVKIDKNIGCWKNLNSLFIGIVSLNEKLNEIIDKINEMEE